MNRISKFLHPITKNDIRGFIALVVLGLFIWGSVECGNWIRSFNSDWIELAALIAVFPIGLLCYAIIFWILTFGDNFE